MDCQHGNTIHNAPLRKALIRMSELTRFLNASPSETEASSQREVFEELYEMLRRMARRQMAGEQPGRTLDTCGLVHEAWLRLEQADGRPAWRDRRQFYYAAATAMRRILVESARRRLAAKRGGGAAAVSLDQIDLPAPVRDESFLAVDEALERLEHEDELRADIVKLRFYAGFKYAEIAGILGVGERTVRRHWTVAKLWLYRSLGEGEGKDELNDSQSSEKDH
jgi:RNA polymerase sigma factor (TIGR02999 family)